MTSDADVVGVDATETSTSSDVARDRERLGRGRGRRRHHHHNHRRHRRAPRRSTSRRRARKMVVRGLPASLTRESFAEALERDGFHADEAFEWMDYVAGRRRRDGGETTTTTTSLSRFYAVVRDGRTVQRMIDAYHGTTFRVRARDGDGNAIGEDEEAAETTTASVERAPSEWTPETYGATFGTLGTPESAGTIEDDEEYVSFVEALEREREEGRTTAPATPRMESTTTTRKSTALLEYIWKKRAQEQRATTGGGKKKSSGKKKSKSSKSKREGKSTTRLDDEPVAADAAPKRKQKPKAKSKKKSTSSTPTTTTPTTTTTTTKVLKRPSSIPTPRA